VKIVMQMCELKTTEVQFFGVIVRLIAEVSPFGVHPILLLFNCM
jgi:hypothetical protein